MRDSANDELQRVIGDALQVLSLPGEGDAAGRTGGGDAERRQLTVLFCDLVGFTNLSVRLDPEELRDIMQAYQGVCTEAVTSFGGFVAQFQGDGIVVYFGYPVANEKAVEDAVRAGLEILRTVPRRVVLERAGIKVRIGIATGVAVVGDMTGANPGAYPGAYPGGQLAVAGLVPNLASRIQGLAEPGTVAIADQSRKIVKGVFHLTPLGTHRLKGIDREEPVWQVDGERETVSDWESGEGDTRHVGRAKERRLISDRWARVLQGQGQVVVVLGEPGIGKSALVRAWTDGLNRGDVTRICLQGSPRHNNSPFYPLITLLRRIAGFDVMDTPAVRFRKIERMLSRRRRVEGTPLLASLLSVPAAMRYAPVDLPSEQRKASMLALLSDEALDSADFKPVVIVLEDAQWLDPTTDELAGLLIDRLAGKRVLLLITARPEYRPVWNMGANVSTISLGGLDVDEAEELIRTVAGGELATSQVLDEILMKADGVPLFLEELTRAVLEAGADEAGAGHAPSVPSTLQDIIMARLDRLGRAKQVAQTGAALGRSFSWTMLRNASDLPEGELLVQLETLVSSGLILARGAAPESSYLFKHALVQDAAYESLLRASRRTLHARIASVLETSFPEIGETEPETIAHHLRGAQALTRAAEYTLRAGQGAAARFANIEAIQHFRAGLRDLAHVRGETPGLLEFNLHLGLAQASYVMRGPAHHETVAAYARAQDFVEYLTDPEQQFLLLWGLFSGHHFAAQFGLAELAAKKFLDLAERHRSDGHLCQANRMLGYLGFFRGDLPGALRHFAEIRRLYRPEHEMLAAAYGADCLVGASGFECVLLSVIDRGDEAVALAADNICFAEQLGHPASIGWAYASAAYVHYYVGDRLATESIGRAGAIYCEDNNIAAWAPHCRIFLAWAVTDSVGQAERTARVIQDIDDVGTRTKLGLPLLRGIAAEMLLGLGEVERALHQVRMALREVEETGQAFFGPTLLRLRGLCALEAGAGGSESVSWLQQAIMAAQRLGAVTLERRCREELARIIADARVGDGARGVL